MLNKIIKLGTKICCILKKVARITKRHSLGQKIPELFGNFTSEFARTVVSFEIIPFQFVEKKM